MDALRYISHYPQAIQQQAQTLIDQERLGPYLQKRYPEHHDIASHKALYHYVLDLKKQYMKKAPPLAKVEYSDKLSAVNALGLHTRINRVQGNKLKLKREILIDTTFKKAPEAFLKMIVVHELAHLKELEHNKAFYQLCQHMEPNYHQYELDLRLYLIWQSINSD